MEQQLQTRLTFELTEDSADLSDPVTLSEVLELFQFSPKSVLDLSHRLIHCVGELAGGFDHLTHLDLSFNYLSSLRGLQSLCSLEALLVSHNCLRTLSSIASLRELPHLCSLDLRYNPVTQETHYRVFTIASSPNLCQLDQVPITYSDRRTLEKQHTEHAPVIQTLVRNHLTCVKLDNLRHRLDLHTELIRRRRVTSYSAVNVHLFLRLVQAPEVLNELFYESAVDHPEQWTRQCLIAQKHQIQSLLDECSHKALQCSQLLESYQHEVKPNRRYQNYDEHVRHKSVVRFSVRQLKIQMKMKVFYAWKLLIINNNNNQHNRTQTRLASWKEVRVRDRMEKIEQYLASNRKNSQRRCKASVQVRQTPNWKLRTNSHYNTPADNRMQNAQKRFNSQVQSARLLEDIYQRLEAVEAKLSLRS